MYCNNCGAKLPDDAGFCPNCGNNVQSQNQLNNIQSDFSKNTGTNGNKHSKKNNKNNTALIISVIVAALVVFISAGLIMFNIMSGSSPFAPKETPIPTMMPLPTTTPTPVPEVTPQIIYVTTEPQQANVPPQPPAQQSVVTSPTYTMYNSSAYGFKCSYPSHFTVYNDGKAETLYSVMAPDGSAREIIATRTASGTSVGNELDYYIQSHVGSVTYKTSGADYFAVNINDGSTEYYKYCKFRNGNMYWFEFISPHIYHDIYDVYINDIYATFKVN